MGVPILFSKEEKKEKFDQNSWRRSIQFALDSGNKQTQSVRPSKQASQPDNFFFFETKFA